ncbi:phosphate regulon transcriptional regulator PhoB [Beggiatoa leptomitoformis]|uniref:Phosphate regulon transcriptional regulatory protein PhoB n=1 Tax=Beggiatoa leptomitoformis TaxID=288004 RepID=A0A2N9YI79_9GAMM|nr:phosphate regulon transcriptional regulator PhoB [Beggiatoa leptomitoformis]ALG67536.1 phosphate regulon transcriptional regulatory protein PhoB [Beggiatoa leptomitoformis]AUI70238.1 phosphate regulon transcriptional regulatory protein PhoB [Beggiatoa leptomitoformis]
MSEQPILIVEDEAPIREMLNLALSKAGFIVTEAADVRQAQTLIFNQLPKLILLDWMLPNKVSGIEFARQLKKEPQTQEIPIIMLTARGEESDKIRGLEVGADDYVTKPFSPRELVARIKAVLRRASTHSEGEQLAVNELRLDPNEHRVTIAGQEVQMGPTEFRLLYFFMRHPERVYSRSQVLDQVWGGNVYIEERTVDVHIRRLRKALADHNYDYLIQTVRGVGYRFSTRE